MKDFSDSELNRLKRKFSKLAKFHFSRSEYVFGKDIGKHLGYTYGKIASGIDEIILQRYKKEREKLVKKG